MDADEIARAERLVLSALRDAWRDEYSALIVAQKITAGAVLPLVEQARQEGAREALRAAAAEWEAQYDEQTRANGSHHVKARAALRMASVLASQRAEQMRRGEL